MTLEATILIAPILTLERFNDPTWARPGRTLYERGSLKLAQPVVPLLVDHRWDEVVGGVTGLDVIEWTDGGPWYYARATVTKPPAWLTSGTRVSFGFGVIHEREVRIRESRAEALAKALVNEVSVLSSAREPAEPRAHVASLRPSSQADRDDFRERLASWRGASTGESPARPREKSRPRRVFSMDEIRRRIEAAEATGVRGAVEMEIAYMRGLEERAR